MHKNARIMDCLFKINAIVVLFVAFLKLIYYTYLLIATYNVSNI